MLIDVNLLLEAGASYEEYKTRAILFSSGSIPQFYFQICSGEVEVSHSKDDGSEFTFAILSPGQSIGEFLLFSGNGYPMNAVAKGDCTVLKLCRTAFLDLVNSNIQVCADLCRYLAENLYHNYLMLLANSNAKPTVRVSTLLDFHKKKTTEGRSQFEVEVPFTRQQIANMTGLRVETVIRTVKKMEVDNLLKIVDGRIFY